MAQLTYEEIKVQYAGMVEYAAVYDTLERYLDDIVIDLVMKGKENKLVTSFLAQVEDSKHFGVIAVRYKLGYIK